MHTPFSHRVVTKLIWDFLKRCYKRITTDLQTGQNICTEYGVWLFPAAYLHRALPDAPRDTRTEFFARRSVADLPSLNDLPLLPGLPHRDPPKKHPSAGPFWEAPAHPGQAAAAPGVAGSPSPQPARNRRGAGGADRPDPPPPPPPLDPDPAEWSNFSIGNVVRLCRSGSPNAIRLTLRKLHVRWWHASARQMQTFLKRVGVPDTVLAMIPEVCSTCQVCREWQRPGNSHQTAVDLRDAFNQQVEGYIMFYDSHMIYHLLDRCTRWHAATVFPDNSYVFDDGSVYPLGHSVRCPQRVES